MRIIGLASGLVQLNSSTGQSLTTSADPPSRSRCFALLEESYVMLPTDTQRIIDEHKIKYVLAQFVDIHGSAKTKSVPVSGLQTVIDSGAGFAGFAICGMGMQPHGPDFMAKGDLSTLTAVPWQPGYGRIVCVGHVNNEPHP